MKQNNNKKQVTNNYSQIDRSNIFLASEELSATGTAAWICPEC